MFPINAIINVKQQLSILSTVWKDIRTIAVHIPQGWNGSHYQTHDAYGNESYMYVGFVFTVN